MAAAALRPRPSGGRVEPHKGHQRPARGGDRAVRGERVQQSVEDPLEVPAGGEGGDAGGFRHQLPACTGSERWNYGEELRGRRVGEAMGALQEPHFV
ncbi:hypothetical protein Pint_09496 [Pistacia integerrima]|uniref:Uncharacterized protein n=1 Tax=Pistacia integerrima TaxID=434235 RepID=A0ACC0XN01_9ROSI|nr:hypothetical protein Pint_09496 [Pistacia integerrima]